jgi:predicted nucleic acid-binding protein
VLVLDTSVLFAALDMDDASGAECRAVIEGASEPLVIPAAIVCELDHLLHSHGLAHVTAELLRDVRAGAYLVEDLTIEDYERVGAILDRYQDLRVGFVDAAVLTIVERLNEPKLATLDRKHFSVMQPRHVDALQLLPA